MTRLEIKGFRVKKIEINWLVYYDVEFHDEHTANQNFLYSKFAKISTFKVQSSKNRLVLWEKRLQNFCNEKCSNCSILK